MTQYALVIEETSIVYGVIELDDPENYDPTPYLLIEILPNVVVGPGFSWDGTNFFPPPVPTPDPVWWEFVRNISLDDGYWIITQATSDQQSLFQLKAVILLSLGQFGTINTEDYPVIQELWNAVVDGLAISPTIQQIDGLNAIAGSAYMTFTFDQDCKIVPNET
ncbi:hypothetical protein LC607_17960 [Nostoc sp. CHAB 5824]|nr:hypothetical protein [Nostoc sp. CHAB 5824]